MSNKGIFDKKTTIADIREGYQAGTLKPSEYIADTLSYIKEHDGAVSAYVDVFDDAVAGDYIDDVSKPLFGVPIAMKSNILIKGRLATASSKILEEYVAPYDATVTERLRNAGAVFVGSTNMDEFAMGSSTENSAFGTTKNPHDHTRVPGGSSGGSAAAVAMGSVPAAFGTDTGGSVRQPASFCGLVGMKPTYGAVSRHGLIAMGSSLDQAGTLTHSVSDAELLHNIVAGVDTYDATTYREGTYQKLERKEVYRIGVPRSFFSHEGIDADVLKRFEEGLEKLASLGHEIVDIPLPYFEKGLAAYYIVMPAEVSSNLARYDGVRFGLHVPGDNLLDDYMRTRGEGFGAEVRRRILLGTYVLSSGYYDAFYKKAELVRSMMRKELAETYEDVDIITTPTSPTPAFHFGAKKDPLAMYLADIFTVPANLTGVPALSVPLETVDRDGQALPIGIQFIGPHAGEARLFDIGKKFLGE